MKRAGLSPIGAYECLREHMLAAVLLKVIEPPLPVNVTLNTLIRPYRARLFHEMKDRASFVFKDIHNVRVSESACIVGLASACRIESRAIEHNLIANGHHHEIYLNDPNRVAPEKLRTVLRQPVRRTTHAGIV